MDKIPEIKLYDYYDFNEEFTEEEGNEEEGIKPKISKEYVIQMFGKDVEGKSYSIMVNGFEPYIYIKVPPNWNKKTKFLKWLKKEAKYTIKERDDNGVMRSRDIKINDWRNEILDKKCQFVKKQKLYGFDDKKKYKFLLIKFKNKTMFNKVQNLWYKNANDFFKKTLRDFNWDGDKLDLYEGHIPPLLRFFHVTKINPGGWITFDDMLEEDENDETTCDYEYRVHYEDIVSLTEKEGNVPLTVMSWDGEMGSSHGDFPQAIKTYNKPAMEIVDLYKKDNTVDVKELILGAFDKNRNEQISKIYYKKGKRSEELIKRFEEKDIDFTHYLKGKDRTFKIEQLDKFLSRMLPKIKGDVITFMGSTFVRMGEKTQYLNHILSLGKCDDIPEVPNSKVISCKTEKELILRWGDLICEENPDIMLGYNIFGFDWKFILDRCRELGCKTQFLGKISKNTEKPAMIKKMTTTLASGTHELEYVKMYGRVQLDLLNHFRREENLPSYKLDYVSSYFIGDKINNYEIMGKDTVIKSKNLMGIKDGDYISIELLGHSTDMYMDGKKFKIKEVNKEKGEFKISHELKVDTKSLRWCLNKDDITLEEMFNGNTPKKRAKIAKYCFQDCNLVHNLYMKNDIYTGHNELANICKVPLDFIIVRGQSVKLLSYMAKECRERNVLMPVLKKVFNDGGYEGAIVLTPKVGFYNDEDPVAVNDYSSLYPSSMISENISHDSKVWTKEYDLNGHLIKITGDRDVDGKFMYDNLNKYKYVDVTYDTFEYRRKTPQSAAEKIKVGYKTCRFAQFPEGDMGVVPSVLTGLLKARKDAKKKKKNAKEDFWKNLYDKRQLGIKVVANSLYGQCGARTSSLYDKDIAASTTAVGRKLLLYAKEIIEGCYKNTICDTKYGKAKVNAEYVYGDTDSVFFKFNLRDLEDNKIRGKKGLEMTIELAIEAGELATKFLKPPHDLEYEKTFMPFLLLSRKRYVGILYEQDPNKGKRKSMGIVLKRRDNAPCVKDCYGGIVDILMNTSNINKGVEFLQKYLKKIGNGKIGLNKLIISKSLRSYYKNPESIAHRVLADRMGERDPGNKPKVGSRLPYIYIQTKKKVKLQGDRIEHPDFIIKNNLTPDYSHYITNQIMKPVQQIFALVLEQLHLFTKSKKKDMERVLRSYDRKLKNGLISETKRQEKEATLRNKIVKELLFDNTLRITDNAKKGQRTLTTFFKTKN